MGKEYVIESMLMLSLSGCVYKSLFKLYYVNIAFRVASIHGVLKYSSVCVYLFLNTNMHISNLNKRGLYTCAGITSNRTLNKIQYERCFLLSCFYDYLVNVERERGNVVSQR